MAELTGSVKMKRSAPPGEETDSKLPRLHLVILD